MIKVSALLFLLCIEFIVLLTAAVIFLVLRMRKIGGLYRVSVQTLEEAHLKEQELQKQLAETEPAAAPEETPVEPKQSTAPTPSEDAVNYEKCKLELTVVNNKLKEKTNLLNELQAKFDDLEKEYLILYQQQEQEQ